MQNFSLAKETNTYGHDDFSIHGGWVPGSACCIDLTSNIDNFYFPATRGIFFEQKENYMKFESAYNKLKEPEGGYTDGKNQIKDEPTNMGIKQSTLDRYSDKYPDKNFPADVKYLTAAQAKEIYKNEYWDNTRIPEITNDRIRDAVFDMNVMGGAGKTVQRALNSFLDANLVVDGAIGSETIKSINTIPDSKVNEFMVVLKNERIDYLKGTKNWETAKNGWLKRTNKY